MKTIIRKSKYLSALEAIEKRNHGLLTPKAVINEARDPDSSLHSAFQWDDTIAGENWRLFQARQLITTVRVRVEDSGEQKYYNATVRVGESHTQGYVSRDRVKSDDEIFSQVVSQAAQELIYWRKKYNSIKELRGIINEAELAQLLEKINH